MLMMLRSVTYQSCVALGMRFKVVAEPRALGRTELLIQCISAVTFVNMLYAAEQLTKAWIGFL